MRRFGAVFAFAAALVVFQRESAADPLQDALKKFSAAWNSIKTYECTATSHEVKGTRVQDRVYFIRFAKPLDTRVDIIAGDGRGSAAVWNGGSRVRGHQGGLLALIRLNVDIHSHIASSLRGTTIAQANWGSLLMHLQTLHARAVRVLKKGTQTVLAARIDPPAPDTDVIKEVYIFGSDGLPREYFQYGEHDGLVKHVAYSGVKINVEMPASTFSL